MNPRWRCGDRSARRVNALISHVPQIDSAQFGIELRGLRQRPMPKCDEQRACGDGVPVQSAAKENSGRHDPIGECWRSLGSREEYRARERLVDGGAVDHLDSLSELVRARPPPSGNSAVMSWVAPSAAAPPNASEDILRTPVPCSLNAHVSPVPMIAAVVTACATGP